MSRVNRVSSMSESASGSSDTSLGNLDPMFYPEHRSHISNHRPRVTWSWLLGHIARALIAGRHDEALARALLGIAAYEQLSIDAGRWTFALDVLLMEAPLFAAFEKHVLDATAIPHSPLFDEQWWEVLATRLKDLDEFQERKKRLERGSRRPYLPTGSGGDDGSTHGPTPSPKPKPKPKPRPSPGPPPSPQV